MQPGLTALFNSLFLEPPVKPLGALLTGFDLSNATQPRDYCSAFPAFTPAIQCLDLVLSSSGKILVPTYGTIGLQAEGCLRGHPAASLTTAPAPQPPGPGRCFLVDGRGGHSLTSC